jgi:hypothetical protein
MDLGSIFLILGILILVLLFISQPLAQHKATAISEEEHEYSALLAERDRVINSLQELDFDHTLGKIPEGVYPSQRAILLHRGAALLRQIDEYHGLNNDDNMVARLESEIETSRVEPADTIKAPIDDELETMIANRRRAREERSGGFCPQCGNPLKQSDRFCPKCGNPLN